MSIIKHRSLFIGILVFCILTLFVAYYIEYVLKHPPCNLCLFERIPYMFSIILTSSVLVFERYEKIVLITIGLFFVLGAIVSFYHFGIEQGFIAESAVCDSKNLNLITKEDVLNSLKELRISCKDVAFKVFGFSLTTYNIFISILMFLLSTKIYLISHDIKK